MSTSKRKRKYAQDFSGPSMTDESFAPRTDVNYIVKHYQETGLDPYADRIRQARYEPASTMTFDEAMRNKAQLDSYIEENPDFYERASEAGESTISAEPSSTPAEQGADAPVASGDAKLAPQDASDAES